MPRDYAALLDLVRDQYYGRLVDVLEVRVGDTQVLVPAFLNITGALGAALAACIPA